ncbi:MAG: hypothetical protein KME27_05065 [Lyngbya sp. HA4199-MV5]|jgi:hypothetical protein|nr:hypothetical protein [Lyngbya sp. HA4199-MV5]
MKLLHSAIVASVVFTSLTVSTLQARADESTVSAAWRQGYADGLRVAQECNPKTPPEDASLCQFDNPYKLEPEDIGDEAKALSNADYIAGFIAGKAEAN